MRSEGVSTTDAEYRNEYVIILTFDDTESDEPKICYVKEFVDSAFSKDFFPKERERQARLKAND